MKFLKERSTKKRDGWENTKKTDLYEVGCDKIVLHLAVSTQSTD